MTMTLPFPGWEKILEGFVEKVLVAVFCLVGEMAGISKQGCSPKIAFSPELAKFPFWTKVLKFLSQDECGISGDRKSLLKK